MTRLSWTSRTSWTDGDGQTAAQPQSEKLSDLSSRCVTSLSECQDEERGGVLQRGPAAWPLITAQRWTLILLQPGRLSVVFFHIEPHGLHLSPHLGWKDDFH